MINIFDMKKMLGGEVKYDSSRFSIDFNAN